MSYIQKIRYLLDEATRPLDDKTKKIMDEIHQICENKTLIIASHQPSIISDCDKIY